MSDILALLVAMVIFIGLAVIVIVAFARRKVCPKCKSGSLSKKVYLVDPTTGEKTPLSAREQTGIVEGILLGLFGIGVSFYILFFAKSGYIYLLSAVLALSYAFVSIRTYARSKGKSQLFEYTCLKCQHVFEKTKKIV
jgi:positive regulator of sigma E activity